MAKFTAFTAGLSHVEDARNECDSFTTEKAQAARQERIRAKNRKASARLRQKKKVRVRRLLQLHVHCVRFSQLVATDVAMFTSFTKSIDVR